MAHENPIDHVAGRMHLVRGQRVMLDADLADLYGVQTERVNQQVSRNAERFPADFMFRLDVAEWRAMYLQNAGTSQRRRRFDRLPMAFTEHGCLMVSNVVRSNRAVEVSVLIVRAFVQLRGAIAANRELAERVDALSSTLQRHGRRLATHERAILKVLAEIRRLTQFPETPPQPIGFTADISSRAKR